MNIAKGQQCGSMGAAHAAAAQCWHETAPATDNQPDCLTILTTATVRRPYGVVRRSTCSVIAVELASTPLPGHLEVTALADTAPGLDDAAPERVAHTSKLADAVTDLTCHTADQRRALAALGAPTFGTARLQEDAGGSWTPHVLLATELPAGTDTEALYDLITAQPRVAGAVVTSTENAGLAPDQGWKLLCAGPDKTSVLPGSGLPIKLQGLTDPHFANDIELLTLSASTPDVPAGNERLEGILDPDEKPEEEAQPGPDPEASSEDPQESSADERAPEGL
ncbi:hypothetical protein ACFVZH_39270 [Streptomyces sp. NPDC059534]|uniref:hypothetical protein n=1 Tax=Streptomyces sp. NPDC059534 TaxID=3346859 RepID=UPI0036A5471A